MPTVFNMGCKPCCAASCCSPEPGTLTVADGVHSTSMFHVAPNNWGRTGGIAGLCGAVEPAAVSFVCNSSGQYTLSIGAFNGSAGATAAPVSCSPFAWSATVVGPDGNAYSVNVTE